ncbi:MAG: hypothetical protein KatS3mg111_4353 [Pirellulaceae bacterium]|nr:MAG: hypothetical protein KatS3mg111_4353 [Pirellulaceae bacterium]
MTVKILATDLDGTLIPLPHNAQNHADLKRLHEELPVHGIEPVYVTGRHLESVLRAIEEYGLPQPDWIVCDVGTSIYRRQPQGTYEKDSAYRHFLQNRIVAMSVEALRESLGGFGELQLQEAEKQGEFKLSYYAPSAALHELVQRLHNHLISVDAPFSMVHSVDPFNGRGLIDFLPQGISKAAAVQWWVEARGVAPEKVVFAGDSGNDLAALTAGYRSIVVANAPATLVEAVRRAHRRAGWEDRLFVADQPATSGVRQGCIHFGWIPATTATE